MALAPYLIHNLAHIELNAIDLAWDTVVRFSGAPLPQQFFADFARVADDEARHLGWCLQVCDCIDARSCKPCGMRRKGSLPRRSATSDIPLAPLNLFPVLCHKRLPSHSPQRLEELGHRYGDLPSHRLLWRGCDASSGDIRARLAVVPMSQEARGLDSGARLVQRLVSAGDQRSASIVRRIAGEEMAHVAVGVEWFLAVCSALGEDPASTYRTVLSHVDLDLFRGEINYELRRIAGLEREWYDPAPETGASGGDEAQGAGKACGLTPLQESELRALGGRLGEIVGVECAMSSA